MKRSPRTGSAKSTTSQEIDGEAVISVALARASERVGDIIFRALWHVALDGAPVTPEAIHFTLTSDEAADHAGLASVRRLTPTQEKGLAQVTLGIEQTVQLEFLKMFVDPDFSAVLRKDAASSMARRLGKRRAQQQTEQYEAAVNRHSGATTTKEILRDMETRGEIRSVGDTYQPTNGGKAIRVASLKSKISRLKKRLGK